MSEKFNQEDYEALLQAAKEDDIHLLHTFNQDPNYNKGGFTIAWQRAGEGKNTRMINVAISYCSPEDYFARKIGALNALSNAYSGQFIQLPINSEDSAEIVNRLRETFDVDCLYTCY
jgi:hypothetical protein